MGISTKNKEHVKAFGQHGEVILLQISTKQRPPTRAEEDDFLVDLNFFFFLLSVSLLVFLCNLFQSKNCLIYTTVLVLYTYHGTQQHLQTANLSLTAMK